MIEITSSHLKILAKMIHEANKVVCESLGDRSQEHWNEAPGYNHESAINGVRAIFLDPSLTPAQSHDVWMENKKRDGWVYGETKCRDKKTHPSMIPYADLSDSEKYKDYIVQQIVRGYIDFIGGVGNYVLV